MIRSTWCRFDRLALARAVEVHDVQEARARLHERAGRLERVVGVDGLLVEVALAQPHRLAVADVHRREQDHRGAASTKFFSSRSPSGPDFSGCDWSPYTGAPLDHAHELAPVLGRAEHRVGVGRPRRERVRVVEGAGRGESLVQRALAPPAHRVPADLRHLEAGRVQRLDRPAQQPDALGAAQLGGGVEQQLHPHAEPDHGHGRLDALAQQLVERELAHALHRLRHRAHPGQHDPARLAHARVVARQEGLRAHVLERLADRAEVPHPVVEDRDARQRTPLVEGTPSTRSSSSTAARRARANALKDGLHHVVRVGARLDAHVQRQLGRVRDRAEELLGELGVEVAHALGGELALEGRERAGRRCR